MFTKRTNQILNKFNFILEKYGYPILFCFLIFLLTFIYIKNANISLSFDELWVVANTNKNFSLYDVIHNSSLKDTWPPIYYIFIHYIQFIIGKSEIYLRFLSLLSTIFSLLILYILTKSFFSKQEAILTCMFFSFSPFLQTYSVEIRGYSLFLFLSLCSFYFLIKFMQDNKNLSLLIYFCFSFICSYVHYFGLYLTLFQIIYLSISKKDFIIQHYFKVLLFLLILFLYPVFHYIYMTSNYTVKDIGIFEHNTSFNNNFNKTTFLFHDFIPNLKINLFNNNIVEQILLFLSLIYCLIKIKLQQNKFLLYFIILPILLLYLESFIFKSFLETRFLIFLFPIIYITISNFIKNIVPHNLFNFVLIVIFSLLMFNVKTEQIKVTSDREQILAVQDNINNLQDTIFIHEHNYNIEYYLDKFNINNKPVHVQWKPDIEEITKLLKIYKDVYVIYEFEESALKYKDSLEKDFSLEQKTKQIFLLKQK